MREHERSALTLVVDYEGRDDFLSDYTENLSSGGMFIQTPHTLEVGSTLRLVLSFPGLLEPLAVEATVRWSRPGDEPGVGVQFRDGPAREKLVTLVERLQRREAGMIARVIKVLIVEDNPHISELIRNGLHASARRRLANEPAFVCTVADTGPAAIEQLETDRFDAVLMDFYIPLMDGSQVIRHARQALGLTSLPIIAVSAGGEDAERATMRAGADMFIDKPMRLRQVIETITQLLRQG